MTTNEWEERARATKAFKIARVLRVTDVPVDAFRLAEQDFRDYVADKAGVNTPSDRSWQMACDFVDAMRDDGY